jgi:hypothetical protein
MKGALVVLFGATLAWLLAPTVLGGPEPPPLWTEADLPVAAVAPVENGWPEMISPLRDTDPPPRELLDLLAADKEGRPRIERARALRAPLAAALDSEPAREALAAFERAIQKPRFADTCPVPREPQCMVFPLFKAHRAALLASIRKAEAGDWPSSITLLARTLRADIDFAATARSSPTAYLIAVASLREASEVASDLFETYRAERARDQAIPPPGEVAVAALTSLDAALAGFDPSVLDGRRVIIADYLFAHEAVDHITTLESWQLRAIGDEAAPDFGMTVKSRLYGFFSSLLLDRGATQSEINARYRALHDAVAVSAPPPSFPLERDEPFWWLYNLTGKVLLDGRQIDWSEPLSRMSNGRERIEALRPGLRKLAQDLSRAS